MADETLVGAEGEDEAPALGSAGVSGGTGDAAGSDSVGPVSVGPAADLPVGNFSAEDLDLSADELAGDTGPVTDPESEHGEVPPARPRISRPARSEPSPETVRLIGSGRSGTSPSSHGSDSAATHTTETPSSGYATGLSIAVGLAMFMAGALATSIIDKWPQSKLTDTDVQDESKVPSITGLQPVGTKGAVWYERKFVPDLTAGSPKPEISFPCPPPKVASQPQEGAQELKEMTPSAKTVVPPPAKVTTPPPPKILATPSSEALQEEVGPAEVPEKPSVSPPPPPKAQPEEALKERGVEKKSAQVTMSGDSAKSIQYREPRRVQEFVWQECWCQMHRCWEWQRIETLVTR